MDLNSVISALVNTLKNEGYKAFILEVKKRITIFLMKHFILFHNILLAYIISKFRKSIFNLPNYNLDTFIEFSYSWNALGIQIKPVQIKEEIKELLVMLAKIKPKFILEIGTAYGGTLFLFSRVADTNAIIISIDLPYGYPKWKEKLYKLFGDFNKKIYLIKGDSHSEETLLKVKEILNNNQLDFLFIDGDHSYEGVKKDFEMYSPLVRKGGIIAFHDIIPDYYTRYGIEGKVKAGEVYLFWEKLKKNYKYLELVKNYKQEGYGIGVIFND
jgi:predicted O-methyltransferase YrrM